MWEPIETAPKDCMLDLYSTVTEERYIDCAWGKPYHHNNNCWIMHQSEIGFGDLWEEVPRPTHWMRSPIPPHDDVN